MPDYYIRTPEQNESRGPFDISKLLTLAEAGQINANTLYYDEDKEEWLPLALNKELLLQVFPEREKLSLKVNKVDQPKLGGANPKGSDNLNVESMLAAAEGDTEEKRKLTRQKKSFDRAANLSATSLGLMMIFSALFMILPLIPQIEGAFSNNNVAQIFNYPTILIGVFDLVLGVLLILSVTEVFPLARGRAMLTLGFGVYVGWAIGDPLVIVLTAAAGIGIFMATLAQSMHTMIIALVFGLGGNVYLAYLALDGRFDGFFETIMFNLIAS